MDATDDQRPLMRWRDAEFGAKLLGVMTKPTYYPTPESAEPESSRISTTVRLDEEEHRDIALIVDLWNALDAALQKKGRKWKASTVMERLLTIGIEGYWVQIGGRPQTAADRKEFVRKAVEALRKASEKK